MYRRDTSALRSARLLKGINSPFTHCHLSPATDLTLPLLQYTRNSCEVGLDVGVCLYPIGMTTTLELDGPLRRSSSGTLVVSSSGNGSVLLLAVLNKKVESNVTAGTAVH